MICTFPRNPQRGYCYDLQPEISHPGWLNFGEQVDFYLSASVNLTAVVPRLQLLHPGYRIEFEHRTDVQWAHYGSWLAEGRGV